jgi:hypothetical protein
VHPIAVLVSFAAFVLAACGNGSATVPSGLFFPTQEVEQDGAMMDALLQGPLVVVNGCVLVGESGDYTLPIWRSGSTVERDGSGGIVVRDADGAVLAVEGQGFEMGGGYRAEFRPADRVEPMEEQVVRVEEWLGYQIPDRCLPRDVYGIWIVGEIEPRS